jgi:hypothetical protein
MRLVPRMVLALVVVFLGFLSCSRQLGSSGDGQKGTFSPLNPGKPLSAITNAAPFRAIVIGKFIKKWESGDATAAVVELQMPDKTIFSVGQTKATPAEIGFLSTLEVGREYLFPDAFREWEKKR